MLVWNECRPKMEPPIRGSIIPTTRLRPAINLTRIGHLGMGDDLLVAGGPLRSPFVEQSTDYITPAPLLKGSSPGFSSSPGAVWPEDDRRGAGCQAHEDVGMAPE